MSNATTTNLVTRFTTPSSLLRKALLADAMLSGITGLALALAAAPLASPLGLAVGLLWCHAPPDVSRSASFA